MQTSGNAQERKVWFLVFRTTPDMEVPEKVLTVPRSLVW